MKEKIERYLEYYKAEKRIANCGCGGICEPCKNEPRPTEKEMDDYESWLSVYCRVKNEEELR